MVSSPSSIFHKGCSLNSSPLEIFYLLHCLFKWWGPKLDMEVLARSSQSSSTATSLHLNIKHQLMQTRIALVFFLLLHHPIGSCFACSLLRSLDPFRPKLLLNQVSSILYLKPHSFSFLSYTAQPHVIQKMLIWLGGSPCKRRWAETWANMCKIAVSGWEAVPFVYDVPWSLVYIDGTVVIVIISSNCNYQQELSSWKSP